MTNQLQTTKTEFSNAVQGQKYNQDPKVYELTSAQKAQIQLEAIGGVRKLTR